MSRKGSFEDDEAQEEAAERPPDGVVGSVSDADLARFYGPEGDPFAELGGKAIEPLATPEGWKVLVWGTPEAVQLACRVMRPSKKQDGESQEVA